MRHETLLTLVLTRRCERRCAVCPQEFAEEDMSEATLDAALERLLPLLSSPARVKLFGGEPLLRPDLVLRALRAVRRVRPETSVELPTRGDGLPSVAAELARRPEVEAFVSGEAPAPTPRAVRALLIAPGDSPQGLVRRMAAARGSGYSRVNLLPAYFTRWSEPQLKGLERALAAAGIALDRWSRGAAPMELTNLERRGSTPLYNDGLVVDCDGGVYASNLILAAGARARRDGLFLGRVESPASLRARSPVAPEEVLRRSFDAATLRSTRAADEALTRFCRGRLAEAA